MSISETPIQPALIIVTGRPGAGKTTLSHALAKAVRCPAICRDEIKEGYVNTTGDAGKANAQPPDVFDAFFATIQLLLSHRITLIAEAAFQHKLWSPKLETLRGIARIRIIVCAIDSNVALARRNARIEADPARERFHNDGKVESIGDYAPPRLDVPTLTVDTSDGYHPNFDQIIAFAIAR